MMLDLKIRQVGQTWSVFREFMLMETPTIYQAAKDQYVWWSLHPFDITLYRKNDYARIICCRIDSPTEFYTTSIHSKDWRQCKRFETFAEAFDWLIEDE